MTRTLLCALVLLAGCATDHRSPARIAGYICYPLQPPASFGRTAEFEHVMHAEYQGRTFELHALLRMDAGELIVLGLTPLGTRAFTIRYDGNTVTLDNPNGPKIPFPPEMILSDIQEMFWPVLPDTGGWHVRTRQPSGEREFYLAGKLVSDVRFARASDGQRVIKLANSKYGYRLVLKLIQDGQPE